MKSGQLTPIEQLAEALTPNRVNYEIRVVWPNGEPSAYEGIDLPLDRAAEWCRRSTRTAALKRRRAKFKATLDRMVTERGTLTVDPLLDFAASVLDQGWHLGYAACEQKHARRQAKREAA